MPAWLAPLLDHASYRFEHHHDCGLVVGAEDRAGGVADDPVLVDHGVDRGLGRNGVGVRAQEDRRPPGPVRRRDAAVHVPGVAVQPRGGVVLVPLEPQVGQVGGDPVGDDALAAGRARHRAELEEELDERGGQRLLIHAGSIATRPSSDCTELTLSPRDRPLVERRRAVPGLSALLCGLQRRRDRRPRRSGRPARVPPVAGRRRDLAQPDPSVAQRRLGLRRVGLHRDSPRPRNARRPRPTGRGGRDAGNPRSPRPGAEPLVDPASVVPRASRLLRLGRRDPEQLGVDLRRRSGLGVRRGAWRVLPAQLRARAAGLELVESGRALGVRANPPVLVQPRRRRLPYRRRARDLQGSRVAGRPRDPGPRHAAAVLDVPSGDPQDPA